MGIESNEQTEIIFYLDCDHCHKYIESRNHIKYIKVSFSEIEENEFTTNSHSKNSGEFCSISCCKEWFSKIELDNTL